MTEEGYEIVRQKIQNENNHSYVDSKGIKSARDSIAKHYGDGKITGEDVVITHGANMGLFYLLLSICNPGDNILVPEPGYPFYHNLAPAMQVEARIYNLLAEK